MNASTPDPRVNLKNPIAAAVLGFLVPGAGHLYQGRTFKAVIYFVCILTLFAWGMQMGHWQLIYRLEPGKSLDFDFDDSRFEMMQDERFEEVRQQLEQMGSSRSRGKTHWGYYAQVPVGLFAIPAFIQEERFYAPRNAPVSPDAIEIEQEIVGSLVYVNEAGKELTMPLNGTIKLAPENGEFGQEMRGSFQGLSDQQEVTLELSGRVGYDSPVGPESDRNLRVRAVSLNGEEITDGVVTASIGRSFFNWFLVPPDYPTLEGLHSELGKKFTLAEVFTWIAGLLNILAIWDAFAGPAYGYRMLDPKDEKKSKEPGSNETGESEQPVAAETSN